MPSPGRSGTIRIVLCACLVLASGLVPLAGAHNPAQTLFHPVPVGDELLVVGGEGTYAYLDDTGTAVERGNLSGQGEVLAAPVSAGGQAATVVRSFPELVPHVQAFDEEGPTWRVQVGEAESFAFVLPADDGFTVFTTEGRQLAVSNDGVIEAEHEAPVPATRPAPASEGGWWVPRPGELAHVVEGEVVDQRDYSGSPTDVTVEGERVLVSLEERDTSPQRATLMVYDASLELEVSRGLEALRLGGQPAVLEDRIVVATYDPSGARILAVNASDASIDWEHRLPEATAAAPALLGDQIVAATTEGLEAFAPDGTPLWEDPSQPYLDSPVLVGDRIVASAADNVLRALHTNGTEAWSWSDGVVMPAWSHHGESEASPEEDEASEEPSPTAAGSLAALVGLAAAALAAGRIRQR